MKIIKGTLAVAMLLGVVSPFEMNMEQKSALDLVDLKVKIANPEEAEKAHRKYQHALVDFYDSLPRGEGHTYYKDLKTKGEDYKECYTAWSKKSKIDAQYVDVDTFDKYYNEIKDASVKRNETIKAEEEAKKKAEEEDKKKAEEEAKKKEEEEAKKKEAEEKKKAEEEAELILADEKEPKKEEPKKEEPKKDKHDETEVGVWPELENLRNAGVAFDNHIQFALANLGKADGELKYAGLFYPQAIKAMEADGNFDGLDKYKEMVAEAKIPLKEYEAAVKAVQDEKTKAVEMLKTKDGLQDYFHDPNFKMVYLRGIARFEGIQSREWLEKKYEELKDTKYEPILKKAVQYSKDLKESDRVAFNAQFKTVLKVAKEWAAAGMKLDESLVKLQKTMEEHHTADNVQAASKYVTEAITQRGEMFKVYKSLQSLNGKEEKAIKEATKFQKDLDEEKQTNAAIWITIAILAVVTVGGVCVCKTKKTCCFADKDEVSATAEGGMSDKTLFKKEVKSKKAHRKAAKESLMPAFKVVDEEN